VGTVRQRCRSRGGGARISGPATAVTSPIPAGTRAPRRDSKGCTGEPGPLSARAKARAPTRHCRDDALAPGRGLPRGAAERDRRNPGLPGPASQFLADVARFPTRAHDAPLRSPRPVDSRSDAPYGASAPATRAVLTGSLGFASGGRDCRHGRFAGRVSYRHNTELTTRRLRVTAAPEEPPVPAARPPSQQLLPCATSQLPANAPRSCRALIYHACADP